MRTAWEEEEEVVAEQLVIVQPLKLAEEEDRRARPPYCASRGGARRTDGSGNKSMCQPINRPSAGTSAAHLAPIGPGTRAPRRRRRRRSSW